MKLDWHITGIQNDKIYSILSAASEETRASEMNVEASEMNVESHTELDSHAEETRASEMNVEASEMNVESRTELDSHANMPVVGKHAYIIAETGKKVDVAPFAPDYKPLTVPLVDATLRYNNPYNGKSYILVLQNALYVLSMENNLIPLFTLREMGVTVNDVPKIHKEDPTVDNHAIAFAETGFRIPLSLWGIFSYFLTSKPTHDNLLNPNEVYILSPAT